MVERSGRHLYGIEKSEDLGLLTHAVGRHEADELINVMFAHEASGMNEPGRCGPDVADERSPRCRAIGGYVDGAVIRNDLLPAGVARHVR